MYYLGLDAPQSLILCVLNFFIMFPALNQILGSFGLPAILKIIAHLEHLSTQLSDDLQASHSYVMHKGLNQSPYASLLRAHRL